MQAVGSRLGLSENHAAYGVLEVVDENMANAARVHSVERGKDISGFSLIAFGGGAPLHAARLAEKLNIARVIIPPNAGVGSAVGFLRAPIAFEVVRSKYMTLDAFDPQQVNTLIHDMRQEAIKVVRAGAPDAQVVEVCEAFMRYKGQGHEIVVPLPARELVESDATVLRQAFEDAYAALFSSTIPKATIEIMTWSFSASTVAERPLVETVPAVRRSSAKAVGSCRLFDAQTDTILDVPVYERDEMSVGQALDGPAIIAEYETTTFVPARFVAHINHRRCIVLERQDA
jgi:N-methylhydantoinase A